MTETLIVFPSTDENALSAMLRRITGAIISSGGDFAQGFLGGDTGYGGYWNSDVFEMHPYCWCEKDDCPWCNAGNPDDNIELNNKIRRHGGLTKSANRSYTSVPNFWHKPSGLRIWWYKYIGRGMEVWGAGDLAVIGSECLQDIQIHKGVNPEGVSKEETS